MFAWQDTSLPPEERTELLIDAMTLEQKIAQLHGAMETIDIYNVSADAAESGEDLDQLAAQIRIERHRALLGQTLRVLAADPQDPAAQVTPDVVIGCVGGGSNFAGLINPFLRKNLREGETTRLLGAEPTACPTLTRGKYAYDFGDTVGMTPLLPMYTLGHNFVPPPVHSGGLRYHGDSPIVSALVRSGRMEAVATPQSKVFEAATLFARTEGKVAAPESAHAVRAALDEALACKESGEKKVIAFNLSGHGHFDMGAYDAYFKGELEDYAYPEEAIAAAMAQLPEVSL